MRSVVLLSGGLDSTVALAWALAEGTAMALTVDYGAAANREEMRAAGRIARHYHLEHAMGECYFITDHFASALLPGGETAIPDAPADDPSQAVTVVPFRNGILLSLAAGLAETRGFDTVVIGCHGGDAAIYPDCRRGFLQAFHRAARLATEERISVCAPLVGRDKAGVIALGRELDAPLELTYSCYRGGRQPCGACGPCRARAEVL